MNLQDDLKSLPQIDLSPAQTKQIETTMKDMPKMTLQEAQKRLSKALNSTTTYNVIMKTCEFTIKALHIGLKKFNRKYKHLNRRKYNAKKRRNRTI